MRADWAEPANGKAEYLPTSFDEEDNASAGMDVDSDDVRIERSNGGYRNGREAPAGRRGGRYSNNARGATRPQAPNRMEERRQPSLNLLDRIGPTQGKGGRNNKSNGNSLLARIV